MSPAELSKPAQATLAIVLLLAALAVFGAIAAGPYFAARELAEETSRQENELALLERRAKSHNRTAAEQLAAETNERFRSALLPGQSLGQSSGALQQRVSSVVSRSGATLKSQQALEPVVDGELMSLATRFVMEGRIEQLRQVLHDLETGLPLVFVDELIVKTREAREGTSRRGGNGGDGERRLEVEMRISAFSPREGR